ERDVHRPLPARALPEDAESSDSASTPDDAEPSTAAAAAAAAQIKERRLRAGMRYTQGGKQTYWLPIEPVDYRAVAFAAGGAGRVRGALFHGSASGLADSAKFVGSAIHPSSRMVRESRRVHRNTAPPTESTGLLVDQQDQPPISSTATSLAELSMDIGPADLSADDMLYAEARQIDGDFNYPVMEIGVAVGYARRRPYGHTLPRHDSDAAGPARPSIPDFSPS
ncbi:hypothetical protein IWW55_005210, partial [Coemansia sp. RSA 2706]